MSIVDVEACAHEMELEEQRTKERMALAEIVVLGLQSKYPGHEIGPAFEEKVSNQHIWIVIPVADEIYKDVYQSIGFCPWSRCTVQVIRDYER